jgi:hypothetical protein
MQEAFVAGYVEYLLVIFLPGIGFCELLGVWRDRDGLAERIAYAFGLGLAVDTLTFVVRTSGLTLSDIALQGIDTGTVYFAAVLGAGALVASLVLRRRFSMPVKPRALDFVLLLILLIQGVMALLYFQKYPIFPAYQSADYGVHVSYVQGLINGTTTSIPQGILYYGVHFQLASAFLLVGGEALVTVQRTMGILVVLSPLLFYLATSRTFDSRGAGLVATAIYALSGTLWLDSVFNSGLYANFFGILAALFLLVVFVDLSAKPKSVRLWIVFVGAVVMTYFSHYTVITVLPALLVIPVIQRFWSKGSVFGHLAPPLVAVAPGGVALLAIPGLFSKLVETAEAKGAVITGSTPVSDALSGWPFLHYLSLEVFSDIAFVFLLVFAAVYVFRGIHLKASIIFIPLVWFLLLLVAAPLDISAWRFSFEALIPLTLMAGFGVFSLVPKVGQSKTKRRRINTSTGYGRYLTALVVLAILLTPLLAVSWGERSLSDSISSTGPVAQAQQDVYDALYWLKDNTPAGASYLSVSDWRFTYSGLFFGRTTDYAFFSQPAGALTLAKHNGDKYVIVTNAVTVALPPEPGLFPWNNFQNSGELSLVYSNSDVRVFQIVQ